MSEHELFIHLLYRVLTLGGHIRDTPEFWAAYEVAQIELRQRVWELHEAMDDFNITEPYARYLLGLPSSYKPPFPLPSAGVSAEGAAWAMEGAR